MADRPQTDRDWKTEATAWRARAEHLQATVDRLRSLAVAGEAAGFLAHELNNLFTPVVGYCHAAQDERADDAIKAKALKKATVAAERVGEVSRAILGLVGSANATGSASALAAGCEAEVAQCVEAGLLALGVEQWRKDGIEVRVNVPRGTFVKVPAGVVQQVMMNLVLNARRAMMGQRGVLEVAVMEVGGMVRMEIRDQGVGMSEDVIGRALGITLNDDNRRFHQFEVDVQDLARSGSINGQARWGVRLKAESEKRKAEIKAGEKNIARLRGARLDASASPIKVWDAAEVAKEMRTGGGGSGGENAQRSTFNVQTQGGEAPLSSADPADSAAFSLHGREKSGAGRAKEAASSVGTASVQDTLARAGTGLGLALCLELVARVGGRITARSVVGEGTVMSVEWPGVGRAKRAA